MEGGKGGARRDMTHLWEVKNLNKIFRLRRGIFGKPLAVQALSNIHLYQHEGETLGLVGESGCGKSTLGRILIGLYPKTGGQIYLRGQEIIGTAGEIKLRELIQMVFQDPYASLNPRMTIRQALEEPLKVCRGFTSMDSRAKVNEVLEQVGLPLAYGERYPHEFSGGQRQRVGIARALVMEPACIICDEPISALDVSIQVQIITLLEKLQARLGVGYTFISHDSSMVRYLSHRLAVMYLGTLVEVGNADTIYKRPLHPYTKALIALNGPIAPGAPLPNGLQGEVPSPLEPPLGCPFVTRCPYKIKICEEQRPNWETIEGREVACHRVKEING